MADGDRRTEVASELLLLVAEPYLRAGLAFEEFALPSREGEARTAAERRMNVFRRALGMAQFGTGAAVEVRGRRVSPKRSLSSIERADLAQQLILEERDRLRALHERALTGGVRMDAEQFARLELLRKISGETVALPAPRYRKAAKRKAAS